jgi:hypothetical protein
MRVFAAAELQRNTSKVQEAALIEPVFLTDYDKPRYVMMSLEEFVKMKGARIVAAPESFPESVMQRIREIAAACPDAEHEIAGGLAAQLDEDAGISAHGAHP